MVDNTGQIVDFTLLRARHDPIVPSVKAIEDLKRSIDYWGHRCELAEAEVLRLRRLLEIDDGR